ncbi:Uncharacterized protein HZ326_16581 [Fusarium oxysporum f. sp. albedinis]|nr:Uncharacterized protein HZ326_16581 [Fusarium oxysporum f. sp. albedinis]
MLDDKKTSKSNDRYFHVDKQYLMPSLGNSPQRAFLVHLCCIRHRSLHASGVPDIAAKRNWLNICNYCMMLPQCRRARLAVDGPILLIGSYDQQSNTTTTVAQCVLRYPINRCNV